MKMKTVNVRARVIYDYQVVIPDNEEGCASTDLASYCDSYDPVYVAMCKLMETNGLQWEGELLSIVDENTDEVLWDGE
jgi:hypothetical protein